MKILIAYATNSGGTKEVAELLRASAESNGHSVIVKRADTVEPDSFANFDLIIFGSCTWELLTEKRKFEGQLQEHFIVLRDKLKGRSFPNKKFVVYGLGDTSYTHFCIAANHLEALVKQLQGTLVQETLRINKFFFNLQENRSIIRAWAQKLFRVPSHF